MKILYVTDICDIGTIYISGAVPSSCVSPDLLRYVPVDFFVHLTEGTIAERIAEVIEDEALRNEPRGKGYRYLKESHDSEKTMERLLNMYRGCHE